MFTRLPCAQKVRGKAFFVLNDFSVIAFLFLDVKGEKVQAIVALKTQFYFESKFLHIVLAVFVRFQFVVAACGHQCFRVNGIEDHD